MDKLKLAALLVLLPLGVLAQGFDYSSIYTVTPEEFPAQQRMAAILGNPPSRLTMKPWAMSET